MRPNDLPRLAEVRPLTADGTLPRFGDGNVRDRFVDRLASRLARWLRLETFADVAALSAASEEAER